MTICVYGASSNTIDKSYILPVEELGRRLAQRGHKLVYGGGATGLMGAVARGVYEEKGEITGVSPKYFNVDGILFQNCTEFIYTETMRERKQIMEDRADAFVMVPGGLGTFDEFFEILTLKQVGRHQKPIAVFDINGYYNAMGKMLDVAIEHDFMKENCVKLFEFFDEVDPLFDYIENYVDEYTDIKDMKDI